jgi:cytochrome P450
MPTEWRDALSTQSEESPTFCPVDHAAWSWQKTARIVEPIGIPIERDAAGVWHVRGFEEARTVLRSRDTKQAGFKAELIAKLPRTMKVPILFQDGKSHQQQRKQTARFFAPKVVSSKYWQMMEQQVERFVDNLQRKKRADLSQLNLELAMGVTGQIVGLTNSLLPGMAHRIETFFTIEDVSLNLRTIMHFLNIQAHLAAFFFLDVKPAIQARLRTPQEDVISHLIAQSAHNSEILTECVTYGAAGIATTREFISIAAWHLLEQPTLRLRYLAATEKERYEMLSEVLRLEPVIGHLYRRAGADLCVASGSAQIVIPKGALIDVHIYGVNADEAVVGKHPLALCPDRVLKGEHAPLEIMSFGDGPHRCPGSHLALQVTDILLLRLLALDGLRIEHAPSISWNDVLAGYQICKFFITVK